MYRITIDVGGTFTDCLVLDSDGTLRQFKAPTTPADPTLGLLEVLNKAAAGHGADIGEFLPKVTLIIHGTTLGTNTLINRNGARTGMITTRNFRDILQIRRGMKNVRTSMYNVFVPPYVPLVPRHLRLEADERVLYSGEVHTPLDEREVIDAAEKLRELDIEAVAVCFLHAYANPAHEQRAVELVREVLPSAYVTASHEVLPVWREYERFSTTVVSAYIGPIIERYLGTLEKRLSEAGFAGNLLLVGSDGLVETVEHCIRRPVYLIGSGPAAAPAAARYIASGAGSELMLSVDMGGTSFDTCMIRGGNLPTSTDGWVQDERVAIKMIDIQSAGAGGGSIAWIDQLGLLRVGPRSAGGFPGPACYQRGGTEPTVTDADLALGYVPADYFLGGEILLDAAAANRAIEKVAQPLGISVPEAASAIFTTVNSYMADQITEVATRRGHDVRDFVLVAGGGAGPVHAAFIAELLHIPRVIIPPIAATYSAFGMFAMDVGRNYARSHIARAESLDLEVVNRLYDEMEREAAEGYRDLGIATEDVVLERTADLRYRGQYHEVEVEVASGRLTQEKVEAAIENFHALHEQLYTFNMRWQGVEFLTFRLRAKIAKAPFAMRQIPTGTSDASPALKRRRTCLFEGREVDTPVYDGALLEAANVIAGPAIVEVATTTVVVPTTYTLVVDDVQNYVLTRGAGPVADEDRLAAAFVTGGHA